MNTAAEQRFETAAGLIWTAVYGRQHNRTPILVLHGGPGFLSMPETVCNLADERPIYFYDQLGCGRSSRAADPDWYTPARYVEELGEVRRRLGLDECYLMGFSWGAMLAALYMLEKKAQFTLCVDEIENRGNPGKSSSRYVPALVE